MRGRSHRLGSFVTYRGSETQKPRSGIRQNFLAWTAALASRACRPARVRAYTLQRTSRQVQEGIIMTENNSTGFVRLYLDGAGEHRATIMDDLDVHVSHDSVVTISGPMGRGVQIDLDDAADLGEVLAEVAKLRTSNSTVRSADE